MTCRFTLLVIGIFLATNTANAQTCASYSYTLTNGQTADANQVMGNFNQILNCANNSLAPLANPHFTGNVGIGTTSPAASLSIQGQLLQVGAGNNLQSQYANVIFGDYYQGRPSDGTWQQLYWSYQNQAFTFTAPVQATSFISTSDARMKTNVQTLPEALSQVMRLRPVRFQWLPQADRGVGKELTLPDETQVGFLAQEVATVVPEAVSVPKANSDTPYGLRDTALLALLVRAVQDQQAEINALKSSIPSPPSK